MKKLAIFDFDGTLFDSVWDVIICFNKALKIHGFPTMTKEEYIPCLGGNINDITSKVLGKNSTAKNIESVKNTYLGIYNPSAKDRTVPFEGTHELLERLQENDVVLAVNSNRLNYSLNEFVDKFFGDINFLAIEGQSETTPAKPDPSGALDIIEKAGVDLKDALYIGDSSTDIKTAKNAGIDCILVKWGYSSSDDFDDEYLLGVADSPLEILDYFIHR